ncbi:hypothetical protein C8J57DRAFT_1216507 [Mycena rebaudengoi]|nr:hypothetical protein C8J57DRAFT_1216507 [Mycena rebaudengoi]
MLKVRTWTNNKPLRNIAMASTTKAANATAVPYVVGFVLSPMQLRTVANKLLKAEVLAMCATDHDYQCHLIDYCYAHKVPWTFLPDKYKESREDYYLWIVRVVPVVGRQASKGHTPIADGRPSEADVRFARCGDWMSDMACAALSTIAKQEKKAEKKKESDSAAVDVTAT